MRSAGFLGLRPIEIREVELRGVFAWEPVSDVKQLWFRVARTIEGSPAIHQRHFAHASDTDLLGSAMRPHGLSRFVGGVMAASLDHAMWSHGPLGFDEWHLCSMGSPFGGAGRGFNRGSILSQDCSFVASLARERLVHPTG